MTIKQYAAEHGVSPQAVYQRLKKNKIRVETLTENGSGEITGEGMVVLDKLFSPENRALKPLKDEKIEALEAQLSTLKEIKARLEESNEQLTQRVEELKKDKETWAQAYLKQQEINLTLTKALPAPKEEEKQEPAQPRRLTWRERFTGRTSTK